MTEAKKPAEPQVKSAGAVKGPKSYFPFIEAKYGRSIEEWITDLRPLAGQKHMEQVAWLKEQGMGHGRAQALVHVFRNEHGGA